MKRTHLGTGIFTLLLLVLITVSSMAVFASTNAKLENILSSNTAPEGVVFEIVDWEDEHLAEAIPWVNQQIISLRQKFPGLSIAVVSHGSEQFALMTDSKNAYPEIHKKVQGLITDHDIKLELCLGHARMRGFDQSDFPDYVDIEASGPSQISAYERLGYALVLVDLE
ncbi:MAG: hypothetical protein V3V09_03540 [Arenicellales bacterium]